MEARHGFSLTLSCFAVGVSLVWWVWATDFIVVELFTDIRILLLLVVLDMFSDLYKFLSLAPGFVFFMFFKVLLFLFF